MEDNTKQLKKGDTVYYIRRTTSESTENKRINFDVLNLKLRTVDYDNNYAVGIEKIDKFTILFNLTEVDKLVFTDDYTALMMAREIEGRVNK